MINEFDAIVVCKLAENGSSNSSHAEGEAEEEAGHGPHFTRDELLCEYENSRESRSKDESDNESEDACPREIRIGHG